jgi:hypothetical protein
MLEQNCAATAGATIIVYLARELQVYAHGDLLTAKLLCRLTTLIMALEHDGRQKVIPDQNENEGKKHRLGGTDSPVAIGGA